MAERGVLIYADMLEIIDELQNDEVAEIMRATRAYLLGQEYQFNSRIAKLSFMPLLKCFEREREKYDAAVIAKTEAVNRRWQKWRENHAEDNTPSIAEQTPIQEQSPPPKKKESPHHADYDWVAQELHDAWATWLDYKQHEQRDTYKSERSLKMAYNKWLKDCEGDYNLAISAVENSIANNYKGIFPPKQNNGTNSRPLTKYELKKIEQQQVAEALARQCADEFAAENEGESISYAIQL